MAALLSPFASATETIPLFTYYADPPFALDNPGNLTGKLADWLSLHSEGRYRFVPMQIPRRRLDLMLAQPHWKDVVAWANPMWFSEALLSRFSWTRNYMLDANLVISLRISPVYYESAQSLDGLRVGSVRGFSYPDLERMIKARRIIRDDADSEFQNLLKLREHRVQAAFLQASSFPYFRQRIPGVETWAYVAPKPRTVFPRAMFIQAGQPDLLAFLNQQLGNLSTDKTWQTLLGTCAMVLPDSNALPDTLKELCRWRN